MAQINNFQNNHITKQIKLKFYSQLEWFALKSQNRLLINKKKEFTSPRDVFLPHRSEEADGPVGQTRNYKSLEHKQEIEQNTRSIRAKHRKKNTNSAAVTCEMKILARAGSNPKKGVVLPNIPRPAACAQELHHVDRLGRRCFSWDDGLRMSDLIWWIFKE